MPAETRAATDTGETRYMRPRPGSQRMYPETDIQDSEVDPGTIRRLRRVAPEAWDARVERLRRSFSLSQDLALKLYDSESVDDFETLAKSSQLEPSFIASVLVDLPPRLLREGVPESALALPSLSAVLLAVEAGKAAKEAVPEILKLAGERKISIDDAIDSMGLVAVSEAEVQKVVKSVIAREASLIGDKGEGAFSPLMGEVMKELRGRVDGSTVARLLRKELDDRLSHKRT